MHLGVILEQCLAPVPGGTGRYAYDLASALAHTSANGGMVSGWVGWHSAVGAARVAGVTGPRRLPVPGRLLPYVWERGSGPAPKGADVVHAPTLLVPPRGPYRLVVTVHDAVPWTHPELLTPRGVAFHRRMAERVACDADLVVVPSDAVRTELAGLVDVGGRVEVVPPGLTRSLALPADAPARATRLGLPAGGFVLSVATLEPRKGLDVLISAMGRAEAPDLRLVVVGPPGWGDVDVHDLAAAAGLPAERLLVLGRVSDPDLAVCYDRATVAVTPSRAEGFGLPVLEAMAAGTPVVASTDPALVEVGGDAVVAVAIGDSAALAAALAEVALDGSRRAAMRVAGLERAAAYDWDRAAGRLWELYAGL